MLNTAQKSFNTDRRAYLSHVDVRVAIERLPLLRAEVRPEALDQEGTDKAHKERRNRNNEDPAWHIRGGKKTHPSILASTQ